MSDLHLGRKSPGDPHGAGRLTSFRQALATLAGLKPDVLVIAGDTFDSPTIEPAMVEEAARSLACPGDAPLVVIIPGNHDPVEAEKLWDIFRSSLDGSTQVRLVLAPEIIPLGEKLIIEAYPCLTRFSAGPPWEKRLHVPDTRRVVHVVVAHGTLQGGPVPEGETDAYPFTQADVDGLAADYVALGHFHGLYPPWNGGEEIVRSICYCGTHEPDQFGSDAGYAVLARVDKGKPARLRRLKVGRRSWRLVEISGWGDIARIEELRKEIQASSDPSQFVIRLKMEARTGWPAEKIEHLERLERSLQTLGAQVERRGDLPAPAEVQTLDLAGLPSGAVKEALLAIQAELAGADETRQEILTAAIQLGVQEMGVRS